MPRVIPSGPITVFTPAPHGSEADPVDRYLSEQGKRHAWRAHGHSYDPYTPQQWHEIPDGTVVVSFFRDLLVLHDADQRLNGTLERPAFHRSDPGPESPPFGWPSVEEARKRLDRLAEVAKEARDLSASSTPDLLRPSAPGYLIKTWGRAAVAAGTLFDAFERQPLLPGMVDVSGSVPT